MSAPPSSPGTSDATCYLERSKVREILIGHNAATQAVLPKIDALPIFTAEDMRASAMTAPMTSREALLAVLGAFYKTIDVMKSAYEGDKSMVIWGDDIKVVEDVMLFLEKLRDHGLAMTTPMTSREELQDALDEWARANLPTESAGCITSWSDWIAAFVCDGVFGDSQMHPLSDIRDLDEVVLELGIQDSSTTPAEAVRELNAEIERLRSVAQAAPTTISAIDLNYIIEVLRRGKTEELYGVRQRTAYLLAANRHFLDNTTQVSSTKRGCGDPACGDPNCTYGQGGHAPSTELASPENKDDLLKKPMCIFCGKRVFGPCESKAMAAGCELPPVTSKTQGGA